jgi:Ca2+-binding EF-hand superfamily protein
MLSKFQKDKLTHYFNILDFDKNGILEEDDFLAIAENLAILWFLEDDQKAVEQIEATFRNQWLNLTSFVGESGDHITLDQWLKFADKTILNGTTENERQYFENFTSELIKNFDIDNDGHISVMEYVDFFVGYRIEVRYSAKSFAKLDRNKDKQISKAELAKALQDFFKSDDPEADGNWIFGGFDH